MSIVAFLLGNWRLIAIAGALLGLFGYGHHLGEASVRSDWTAADAKRDALQREADEQANLLANRAALRYEERKAAQVTRVVTITKEVNHAIEADPDWASEPVPLGVRGAIAAAVEALAPAQPDVALPVPGAGGEDERATGAGVLPGPGRAGGLQGPAPSPR